VGASISELSSPDISNQLRRPGRTLLGWLTDEQAVLLLSGQMLAPAEREALIERASAARRVVASRPLRAASRVSVEEVPPMVLDEHMLALNATPSGAQMIAEGWRVQVVDLREVHAAQTHVFTDHAVERAQGIAHDDIAAIARVSLPLPASASLPAQFDQSRQAWIVSAANPNLRIVGHFGHQLGPGVLGFGFAVAILPSFLQVAITGDRMILRDGYHRAYGFLRQGIFRVPVFARDFGPHADLGFPPGMLMPAAYLGDRAPLLTDYDDPTTSASVSLPVTQKMIVVQGLELTPIG
jgi:hypothetical protein